MIRRGGWKGWALDFMLGNGLSGKTLGIIGYGRIGQAVAARAVPFGMRVIHSDVQAVPGSGAIPVDRLLATADIVSIHCPLTPETRHMINQAALARMKRSAYLINTSRGPVVDEAALVWALKNGIISGAALDVYEEEPMVHPDLLTLENVVLAPHLGSATTETRTAMADLAVRNAIAVLTGQSPLTPVSPVNAVTAFLLVLTRGRPNPRHVERVMRALARAIRVSSFPPSRRSRKNRPSEPFQILIATLLSARTQDATTHAASTRLFKRARTPRTMAALPVKEIERLIYPVSFYRNKARHVKACCEMLMARFGGRVPRRWRSWSTLPGVGRKTANLVMILAFKSRQNICVDTHVHRISNRLGWVGRDDAGGDRAGAVSGHGPALVAAHQSVSGDMGPECLPAVVAAVRRVRDCRGVSHGSAWSRGRYIEATEEARMKRVIVIALLAAIADRCGTGRAGPAGRARGAASALPVVVFETSKGNFEMELYPAEAPKSVEHILTLVRRNFYNGLRVHRFVEGFVVQFGTRRRVT